VPSFEEARNIILDRVSPLGPEVVPILDAIGRVLAEDLIAPRDLPAWDNSAMDGYAVRAESLTAPVTLALSAYIPAGSAGPNSLAPGTAAKILTGAPLPAGADTVVPIEEAEERDGRVLLRKAVRPGAHVRRRGEDIRAGERVLGSGTLLRPAEVSFLATCPRLSVSVYRRPRVAILSTGDELVGPGEPLAPGKIYDSNALAMAAAVKQVGAEPTLLGIARDEHESLRGRLAEGLRADALVTTAGVSKGDRDLVREVLAELEVRQVFWNVDIKPGRPMAFAMRRGTPVFSLPGNPVSTLLTFEQFVRPALLRMMGHRDVLQPLVTAIAQDELRKKPGRVSLVRVRLERRDGELQAWSAGNQDTGILRTMLRADGVAIIPGEWGDVRPGTPISVQLSRSGFETSGADVKGNR
jgi:molybdopterin molybdotransferase